MFLEGARWDYEKHHLTQSRPKELFSDWPLMHCIPKQNKVPKKVNNYNCPVYKVVSRKVNFKIIFKGTLSTTGHSTNFVMFVEVPSNVEEKVWIKAGVAGFLALRY
jgi:dynein heavy chain